jgi:membrane protease subunit (stomatin/prohibitin family)
MRGEIMTKSGKQTQCAWCGKYKVDGIYTTEKPAAATPENTSHSVCPECTEKVLQSV